MGILAREVALDVAESVYKPDLGIHIPGVANVSADILSRLGEPKADPGPLPEVLSLAKRVAPPRRDQGYYRALFAPSVRVAPLRILASDLAPRISKLERKNKSLPTPHGPLPIPPPVLLPYPFRVGRGGGGVGGYIIL